MRDRSQASPWGTYEFRIAKAVGRIAPAEPFLGSVDCGNPGLPLHPDRLAGGVFLQRLAIEPPLGGFFDAVVFRPAYQQNSARCIPEQPDRCLCHNGAGHPAWHAGGLDAAPLPVSVPTRSRPAHFCSNRDAGGPDGSQFIGSFCAGFKYPSRIHHNRHCPYDLLFSLRAGGSAGALARNRSLVGRGGDGSRSHAFPGLPESGAAIPHACGSRGSAHVLHTVAG